MERGGSLAPLCSRDQRADKSTLEMLHCILKGNKFKGKKACGACKGLNRVMCFLRRHKEVCNGIHLSLNDFSWSPQ